MPRYKITGILSGRATWYVDADSDDAAIASVDDGNEEFEELDVIEDSIVTTDCEFIDDGDEEDHRRDR